MKKPFYLKKEKFDLVQESLRHAANKYYITIIFLWIKFEFRFMLQDGNFHFRWEQLYFFIGKMKRKFSKNDGVPF